MPVKQNCPGQNETYVIVIHYCLWKLQHQEGDMWQKWNVYHKHGNRQTIRITELYMVCEHVISIWCEASMCCNQSLYASWHGIKEALDIFLGNVLPCSLYASPQSVKSRCWRTLMNKSPNNHIPDMFDGRHAWRTCRPGKQWYPSSLEEGLYNPCHVCPGIFLLKYGMWSYLKEGHYLGL